MEAEEVDSDHPAHLHPLFLKDGNIFSRANVDRKKRTSSDGCGGDVGGGKFVGGDGGCLPSCESRSGLA